MKVSVTYKIPEKGIEFLKKNYDVWVNPEERNLTKEELKKVASESDAMITLLSDKIDQEVIEAGKGKLKIISNYAVGYNNIDVKTANENGIVVTNTPDVLTETTADLAWALMMSAARRIVEADKFVREGNFVGWKPELLMGQDVFGKTLGIIGLGRIGLAVARRAKGFNMEVLYNKRTPLSKEMEKEYGIRYAEIDEILENADFVSLNVPLTPDTDHLLNKEKLDKMKVNSVLVNTSRGKVIDEAYLAEKLEKKEIAAAGLDVFEFEPEVNEKLLKLNNVVVAPHIGSASKETRDEMSMMVARDIDAVLSGKDAKNVVKVWGGGIVILEFKNVDEIKISKIAKALSNNIKGGHIILLYGDLGTGKTTFSKYFISSRIKNVNVTSPTFAIENIYGNNPKIHHIDLYRIQDPYEIEYIDLFADKRDIYLIEWADYLDYLKPDKNIEIWFEYSKNDMTKRDIKIKINEEIDIYESIKQEVERWK